MPHDASHNSKGNATALTKLSRRRNRSAHRRSGYVLIVVLGLAVVAFSTGVAFIESQGTVLPEAVNRMAAVRARYMAESGVELAMHYLMYPPTSVEFGDYWPGAAEQRVDSTDDYFTVVVQKDASVEGQYTIDCKGVALYYDGEVRGVHTIRATVLVPPSDTIAIRQGYLAGDRAIIDTGVIIDGDLHVNENLWAFGVCSGHVSATALVIWSNPSPPASITQAADKVTVPTANISAYPSYVIRDNTCTALLYSVGTITPANAVAINSALDAQTNNPGRIVYANTSSLRIYGGAQINGTIVVDGPVEFDGSGTTNIVAVDRYPALVSTDTVSVKADSHYVGFTGTVLCGDFDMESRADCRVALSGAIVTTAMPGISGVDGLGSYFYATWNEDRSKYYDLTKTGDSRPITILSWKENY